MKIAYVISLTIIGLLAGCTATTTSTNSTNLGTTTSTLEEVPPDVTVDDTTELPDIVPLTNTGSEYLIGSWQSDCLIPDENSDYAERHTIIFYGNRTATYTAENFYKKSCEGADYTETINYSYTIPTAGQINLTNLVSTKTLYDIYQVQGNQLMFGHGFRNTLPYPTQQGVTAVDRITTLNTYIVYTKTQ